MKKIKVILSLFLVFSLLGGIKTQAASKMTVHYINVGQGDSIYIKTANGDDIIIGGGNKDGSDVVAYLKKQGVKDIEVMVATHPDVDHIGGLDEVLNALKVKSVYAPKVSHTTQAYSDFLNAVKREGVGIKAVTKGLRIPLKGVTATFVAPVKTYGSDLNDWSAVLRIVYGSKSFLFTGDAEFKSETDMINSKQTLRSDVLKVGHHGAKTSTSIAFLNAVKPTYAVISVGKGNSYGHPTSDTLNRLKAAHIKVFRTDQQGHIIASTDGKTITFNVNPTGTASKPAPKPPVSSYKLSANVNNTKPKQNSTIYVTVKGIPSGTYKAVFHYKSTNTTYSGTIGKALPVKIGRAAKGYKVVVEVSTSYNGKAYKTQTSFIPQ